MPTKAPVYPRPVPQIPIEEVPVLPGEVVYVDDEDGFSGDGKDHVARRRRIENAINACLRGEPVFIVSAGLKGPFGEGWKNPWAKARRKEVTIPETAVAKQGRTGKPREVPETSRKTEPAVIDEDEIETMQKAGAKRKRKNRADAVIMKDSMRRRSGPFHAKDIPNLNGTTTSGHGQKLLSNDRRIEDWLRTNNALSSPKSFSQHDTPSPTQSYSGPLLKKPRIQTPKEVQATSSIHQVSPPRDRPTSKCAVHSNHDVEPSQNSYHVPTSMSKLGETVSKGNGGSGNGIVEDLSKRAQRTREQTLAQQSRASPIAMLPISKPLQQSDYEVTEQKQQIFAPANDSSRAEFAILKSKRRSIHTAPASSHMSPFEYKRTASDKNSIRSSVRQNATADLHEEPMAVRCDGNEQVVDEQEAAAKPKDEDVSVGSLPQPPPLVEPESVETYETAQALPSGPPLLTAETSRVTAASHLPSAQHPSMQALLPSTSTLSEPAKPLEIVHDEPVLKRDPTPETHQNPTVLAPSDLATADATAVTAGINSEPVQITPRVPEMEINTQQMLAAITPFGFSTVKKVPTKGPAGSSPTTATKVRKSAGAKRTSFAADGSSGSSQGSIKSAMKTTKTTPVQVGEASASVAAYGKLSSDMRTLDEGLDRRGKHSLNSPQPLGASKNNSSSIRKGILKSAAATPTDLFASRRGTPSTMHQDAQHGVPNAGAQALDESDMFDLDAAIDDLGSFLGTWDAEKEASSLTTGGTGLRRR